MENRDDKYENIHFFVQDKLNKLAIAALIKYRKEYRIGMPFTSIIPAFWKKLEYVAIRNVIFDKHNLYNVSGKYIRTWCIKDNVLLRDNHCDTDIMLSAEVQRKLYLEFVRLSKQAKLREEAKRILASKENFDIDFKLSHTISDSDNKIDSLFIEEFMDMNTKKLNVFIDDKVLVEKLVQSVLKFGIDMYYKGFSLGKNLVKDKIQDQLEDF